jgi:serine phosphatase RsbU (regulator of sigma subunit)
MNPSPRTYDNADVELLMATDSELQRFAEMPQDLAGREFLAPGFLSTLFAAERRATHEAEELKAIESSLFPRALPATESLDYAGLSLGARHVGGDFYDFFSRGEGRTGIVIGDVAGKGIPAALLRANLQATLRTVLSLQDDLEQALTLANKLFYQSTPQGSYATLLYVEYDQQAGRLRYVNCGHPAAILLRRDGSVLRLETTSTVVGLFENWRCSIAEVEFKIGDTLLLFTDGIIEACSESGDEFGEQRLTELLETSPAWSISGLLQAIVGAVGEFSGGRRHDDMTLVGLRCGNFAAC